MEHFKDYLSVLTGLITIFTVAIFGFLLPKFADYFNDRPRNKLKDTLDIKKSLEVVGRAVDPKIDQIIDYYENEFIRAELELVNSDKKERNKKLNKYLDDTFRLVIFIPIICLVIYMVILATMN